MDETASFEAIEDLVFGCFEADDPAAALEDACQQNSDLATRIRGVVARLQGMGLAPEGLVTRAPQRLGPFEIRERLGEGGMGVVYRAWQDTPGREVALKVVRPDLLHFGGSRQRFLREVEATARLAHPGIVPIYECGETEDGVPWFSMAYIRGRSLAAIIADHAGSDPSRLSGADLRGAITGSERSGDTSTGTEERIFQGSWTQAMVEIVRQVAVALQHAHALGVLHRDVKPSNIMLTVDGRAMLVDFGLARTEDSQQLTHSNTALGSLPYMAPEALEGVAEPGPHLDVYGLGVTLYEVLALVNPFLAETALATRERILDGRPRPLRKRNLAVGHDLATVVGTAMDPESFARYGSASDLAADLASVQQGLAIAASPDSSWRRVGRFVRRNRLLVGSTVTLLAVLLASTMVSTGLFLRAEKQRDVAEHNREDADWSAYVAGIDGAEDALRSHQVSRALERLRRVPAELRGWEWRHLVGRLDQSAEVLLAHSEPLLGVSASRDGGTIAVHTDAAVLLRSGEAGQWRTLETGPVCGVCVAEDGTHAAWAGARGVFRYDVAAGAVQRRSERKNATAIAMSSDGQRVAVGMSDGWFLMDDGERIVRSKRVASSGVRALCFAPDGRTLAVSGGDRRVVVVESETGRVGARLSGHRGQVTDLAFSPDGGRLASASQDGTVMLWSVEGEALGFPLSHETAVTALAFHENGRELACIAAEGIYRWSVRVGLPIGSLHGHTARMTGLAWGGAKLTASVDGTLRRWEPAARGPSRLKALSDGIDGVAVAHDGGLVSGISASGVTRVFDTSTGKLEFETVTYRFASARDACFDAASERMAFVAADEILVCGTADWSPRQRIEAAGSRLRTGLFTPDGRLLITASDGGAGIIAWSTSSGAEAWRIDAGPVTRLTLRPDRAWLAAAGDGLRLFSLETRAEIAALVPEGTPVAGTAFSADGQRMAAGVDDAVVVWRTDTFEEVLRLSGHIGAVQDVAFEPAAGGRIVSVGADSTVRLADPATGREVGRLISAGGVLRRLAFSRDGRMLVSGDAAGDLWLWRADADVSLPASDR